MRKSIALLAALALLTRPAQAEHGSFASVVSAAATSKEHAWTILDKKKHKKKKKPDDEKVEEGKVKAGVVFAANYKLFDKYKRMMLKTLFDQLAS
eukprot:NODE_504_length_1667_cov_97.577256_g418_i0.p2 GENE.NODE_504_length_1667_cov_97.577256_g418_i0~~NODE_504_length_1667_cov_97.577256_g418_i0.p2  ORF type:complete len:107 (-),score=36.30 NODE_504_length_1667_cov_97.577256_g418_i0:1347-1631(-)